MERLIYQKLMHWKDTNNRKPLLLKGVRQCGKTYLLKEFGNREFSRTHYINFEKDREAHRLFEGNLDPREVIKNLSFHLDTVINFEKDFIIFDEIQACPNALTSLKYFSEDMPQLFVSAAGSLLGIHLSPASFPVGQVTILSMYPLSFIEFLLALDDQKSVNALYESRENKVISPIVHVHLWKQLLRYFVVGGLPEVVLLFQEANDENFFETCEKVRKKQHELIFAYYADIAKHSGKASALHIDRILRSIPTQLARNQDGSAKKFQFCDVVPGIDRYSRLATAIDWLDAAQLTIRVPIVNHVELPLSGYMEESTFKLYLFDVGILGAMGDLPPKAILDYNYGTYKGYFAENFIAEELMNSFSSKLYAWQDKRHEVEFLVTHGSDILPIEVKSGWVTKSKSLHIFMEKYRPPFGTIMSAHPLLIDHKNRFHHYPLYLASQFLL